MNTKLLGKILLFGGICLLALYLFKMMKGSTSTLPGTSGAAGGGVSWLNPFGTTTAAASSSTNLPGLITAGTGAFTGLVGSLKGLFGSSIPQSGTANYDSTWTGDNYFGSSAWVNNGSATIDYTDPSTYSSFEGA